MTWRIARRQVLVSERCTALAAQALWLLLAAAGELRIRVPGAGIAWYYLLMTAATMAALVALSARGRAADVGEGGGHPLELAWQP